jgi:phosphate transport system permease protein
MSPMRTLRDRAFWVVCSVALALIATPSIWVLISIFSQAAPVMDWHLLTHTTAEQGLLNAILGTLYLLAGVAVFAGTTGVAAGIWLAEFGTGRLARSLRFYSEILAGMPSIVIGYIGYITLVVQFGWGYSYLAAVIALSALVLPYIVKTTEVAFRQVPTFLREAAAGLGMTRTATVWRILLPTAIPGVLSGLVVALAISTGELAPLLFTAGFSDGLPPLSWFDQPVPYLTDVIYTDLSLPGETDQATAAAAGAFNLILIIMLIIAGRLLTRRARKATARMSL